LETDPRCRPFDLIGGNAGFCVYLLERLGRPAARRALQLAAQQLLDQAEDVDEGCAWFTPPALLVPEALATSPNGLYNVGVAHGAPGVIGVLARLSAVPGLTAVRPLIERATQWVLARQGSPGRYPATIPLEDRRSHPTRSAWCYGDPGVSVALLQGAIAIGDDATARRCLASARAASQMETALAGVVDAGLCHGATGLGHLYNRLYQSTRDEQFLDAARRWFSHALRLRRARGEMAGWVSWMPGPDGKSRWVPDGTLLTGVAGIGLALLAAALGPEPRWDRPLLVDLVPNSLSKSGSIVAHAERAGVISA
jgi:lantibiotic modifying enzyme